MSRSATVIVGAGIAGIVAAFFELQKGKKIQLIEIDSTAGGLLKSVCKNGHYFDYGTHVYVETGISELDSFLFSHLTEYNCNTLKVLANANFFRGTMNEKSGYVDASVLPRKIFNQGCIELLSTVEDIHADNLSDYFKQKFGESFYRNIFEGVANKYFGISTQELSVAANVHFDMARILAFDRTVTERLRKIECYSPILGDHVRREGKNKYYPKDGGAGALISQLMEKLDRLNVGFMPSTKITEIRENEGTVSEVVTNYGPISANKLIWTLPTNVLMRLIRGGTLMNSSPPIFRSVGLFDFVFRKPINSNAAYINVYDTNLISGRITVYQNLTNSGKFNCTVEVLTDQGVDLSTMVHEVLNEMIIMGLIDSHDSCVFSQFRSVSSGFPVLTMESVRADHKSKSYCDDYFKNVLFLGRSPNKFFMSDILVDAYEKISNQD